MIGKITPFSVFLVVILAILALSLACSSAPAPTAVPAATARPAVAPTQEAVQPTVAMPRTAATAIPPTPTPTRVLPTPTPASTGGPVYGGTLKVAYNYDAPSMDPAESTGSTDAIMGYTIFDKLVELGPDGQIVPVLAKSWDVSTDGKTITFHLVQGLKFTDGTPLNAQAVKYNMDRIMDPQVASPSEETLNVVQSVAAPNDSTLVVTLNKPWRPFLASITAFAGEVASPTAIEKYNSYMFAGTYGEFGKHPVGSGPFKLTSWNPGQSMVAEKNPDYWQPGKPYLDKIELYIIGDPATATAMVRTGEIDVDDSLASTDVAVIEKSPLVKLFTVHGAKSWDMVFNLKHAPFNSLDLRQAIAYGIDRQQIVKVGFDGLGSPGYTFTPTGWASNPNLKPIPYDPQQAAAKLNAAGYPNGVTVKQSCSADTFSLQLCQIVQQELKAVNINMQIDEVPSANRWDMIVNQQIYFSWTSWGASPDPHINLQAIFQTGGAYSSIWGYSDSQVDSLLTEAGGTYDTAQAKKLYDQAQTIIAQNGPFITTVWADVFTALNVRVQGYVRPPDLDSRLRDVWLEK